MEQVLSLAPKEERTEGVARDRDRNRVFAIREQVPLAEGAS